MARFVGSFTPALAGKESYRHSTLQHVKRMPILDAHSANAPGGPAGGARRGLLIGAPPRHSACGTASGYSWW